MIKAILADDEHHVRKGLVELLPWRKFGIDVIADAPDGRSALAYLADHRLDLLITDLSMPGMSGLELLKEVRRLYPWMRSVVLTCHQEFPYIQEAMRAGAIDYIVKTQLEDDEIDRAIERISKRMKEESGRIDEEPTTPANDQAVWLIPAAKHTQPPPHPGLDEADSLTAVKLHQGGCLIPASAFGRTKPADYASRLDPNLWSAIIIDQGGRHSIEHLAKICEQYAASGVYYDLRSGVGTYCTSAENMERSNRKSVLVSLSPSLRAKWRSFLWLYDENAYRELMEEVRTNRPPNDQWTALVDNTMRAWRFAASVERAVDWAGWSDCRYWQDAEPYIGRMRPLFRGFPLSDDVCICLLKAIDIIASDLRQDYSQQKIADRVGMSRSYFSKCFLVLIGVNFNEYVKKLRIGKARELLEETNEHIYRVAELCGFQDEKYFSKVFRSETGTLPTEYRVAHRR
jgi:two-component system response regulator YesN